MCPQEAGVDTDGSNNGSGSGSGSDKDESNEDRSRWVVRVAARTIVMRLLTSTSVVYNMYNTCCSGGGMLMKA